MHARNAALERFFGLLVDFDSRFFERCLSFYPIISYYFTTSYSHLYFVFSFCIGLWLLVDYYLIAYSVFVCLSLSIIIICVLLRRFDLFVF